MFNKILFIVIVIVIVIVDMQPSSAKDLGQTIKEVWLREISPAYCRSLIDSMPKRLKTVVQNKGGHTKY